MHKGTTRVPQQMGQGPTDDSFEKDMNKIETYFQLYTNCYGVQYHFHNKSTSHFYCNLWPVLLNQHIISLIFGLSLPFRTR